MTISSYLRWKRIRLGEEGYPFADFSRNVFKTFLISYSDQAEKGTYTHKSRQSESEKEIPTAGFYLQS